MSLLRVFLMMAMALPAMAGGFFIELAAPTAKIGAPQGTVAVAHLVGCHQAERGKLTATAEGIVDGKRKSAPVTLTPLATPGMYAVQANNLPEGQWALHLTATHPEVESGTTTLVRIDGKQYHRGSAKQMPRKASASEVDDFLRKG